MIPKAWEELIAKGLFLPVIVKTLERMHDANWDMELNEHDHFEMVYMKRGNAVFRISGEDVLVGPNDIVIIKPFQMHKFNVKSGAVCEFIVLSFKFHNQYNHEFSDVSLNDFIEFVKNKESGAYITLNASKKNEIVSVLNRILREKQNHDVWGDILSYLLIMELFVMVSRALKAEWQESIGDKGLKLKELMHVAKKYIEDNCEKELGIEDISKYLFLSQSYFAHAFKKEFNISPKSYLLLNRIERSKEMLLKSRTKICDIALSVGFSSQQRYNDIFKKIVGITPKQYRKNSV